MYKKKNIQAYNILLHNSIKVNLRVLYGTFNIAPGNKRRPEYP